MLFFHHYLFIIFFYVDYVFDFSQINTMKPTIDCGPPRAHPFSNKNEMEKQRFQNVVEMDNRLMLERLAKVDLF